MKRLLLAYALAAASLLAANPPAYISGDYMRCGATRRGESVQMWCYTGLVFTADTYIWNSIFRVRIWDVVVRRAEYSTDVIEWTITRGSDDVMHYSVVANGVEHREGPL